tara:strand:- start:9651 stop:10514 length:864 start_codon:yes stop_codon:yes gene_type:complete
MIDKELSIVCATHNNEKKLFQTVLQILKSSILPQEIIIVSTSFKYKEYFSDEFINKNNIIFKVVNFKSQTRQRACGINLVNTKYIIQIDDDIILDKYCINNMLKKIKKNKKTIIGGLLLYNDNTNVYERFTKQYLKNKFLKLILIILNSGKQPEDMSVLSSGRMFPKLSENIIKTQWLSSFIIYEKKIYKEGIKIKSNGKGYFEDVIFSNSLYQKGYNLIIDRKSIGYLEESAPIGLTDYIKSLPNFIKLVIYLKKNKLLFFLDVLIFFNIHLFVSILKILRIKIHS